MRASYLLYILLFLCGCSSDLSRQNILESNGGINGVKNNELSSEINKLPLDSFFIEIDTCFSANRLLFPDNMNLDVLFSASKDIVITKDQKSAPAKGYHDMIIYIPIDSSSSHGWLYVGHESTNKDTVLGDGGGGTMFEVKLEKGQITTSMSPFPTICSSLMPIKPR